MVSLVFFNILQLPHTVISNSEKLTHPSIHMHYSQSPRITLQAPGPVMVWPAPYNGSQKSDR